MTTIHRFFFTLAACSLLAGCTQKRSPTPQAAGTRDAAFTAVDPLASFSVTAPADGGTYLDPFTASGTCSAGTTVRISHPDGTATVSCAGGKWTTQIVPRSFPLNFAMTFTGQNGTRARTITRMLKSYSALQLTYLSGTTSPDCFALKRGPVIRRTFTYKSVYAPGLKKVVTLRAYVHYPPGFDVNSGRKLPAVLLYHGGGWSAGAPIVWFNGANYLASRGLIAIAVQYRVALAHLASPLESTADAKSAVRWARKYAAQLGIDPYHIATEGDSAGGHLALAVNFSDASVSNETGADAAISPLAQYIVAHYPIVDTSLSWPGLELISPVRYLSSRAGAKVLIEHGTADDCPSQCAANVACPGTPLSASRRFCSSIGDCTFVPFDGAGHAFLQNPAYGNAGMVQADLFYMTTGIISGIPSLVPTWVGTSDPSCQMPNVGYLVDYARDYGYPGALTAGASPGGVW